MEFQAVLMRFWRDRRGATAIEYCLIAGLVSIAIVAGVTAVDQTMKTVYYQPIADALR